MFYKYTTDITKSGRKKKKQARTWVRPKRKKGEFFGTFLVFCDSKTSVYPNEIPTQLPWTLTHPLALADLASGSTSPNSSLQQSLLYDRRLSLAVTNSSLFTALGPCLSSSSFSLVGNLVRKPFVLVSRQSRQKNPLTGTDLHPHLQNECPSSCHSPISVLFFKF